MNSFCSPVTSTRRLLPAIDIMSWRLKAPQEELLAALCKFEQLGITSRDENGNWFVTNFARRQAAFSGADRSRRYRQHYANRDEEDEIQGDVPVAQSPDDPVPQAR
jgi:RecB family endonuclease NucS